MLFTQTTMEQSSKSFFPKLVSILFIAMGIFLGIYAFFANATIWTINGNSWDNSHYITSDFWTYDPNVEDITRALYGSGMNDITAYTQARSGSTCDPTAMTVAYAYPGTDTLPQQLS
ncbi:MAG: hypothetical protein WCL18_07245 [bacterium]